MDYKQFNMKWLASELKNKLRDSFCDEKLTELKNIFNNIVGSNEKPSLENIGDLPNWFLLESIEYIWNNVKDKEFFLHTINKKFTSQDACELKVQIASIISISDPQSCIYMLSRIDGDKNFRKKGKLPKFYIDLLVKYFFKDDQQSFHSIIEHTNFEKNSNLNNVSRQFFECLFCVKISLTPERKYELQYKFLNWIIVHNQYLSCTEKFPDVLSKEVNSWPMSMYTEYYSIYQNANKAEVKFNPLNSLIPIPTIKPEDKEIHRQKLLHELSDNELLEEIGKRLNYQKNLVREKMLMINEQSTKISGIEKQKNDYYQKINILEDEKRKMLIQTERNEKLYNNTTMILNDEIQKCKNEISEKNENITKLHEYNESKIVEHKKEIDKISKRVQIESVHSKNELIEKIQDSLSHNFKEMTQLSDSEKHRTAKIMLEHVFDKLTGLGMTFNQ